MGTGEPLSEEHRQQIINQIRADAEKAGFPDYDVESRLAGDLAGPASEDRPDVPVWHYFDYVAAELKPDPIEPSVVPTAADVVRRYAMMHDAGILGWNSSMRMIERLGPLDCEMKVYRDWWNQLLDHAGFDGPRP